MNSARVEEKSEENNMSLAQISNGKAHTRLGPESFYKWTRHAHFLVVEKNVNTGTQTALKPIHSAEVGLVNLKL